MVIFLKKLLRKYIHYYNNTVAFCISTEVTNLNSRQISAIHCFEEIYIPATGCGDLKKTHLFCWDQ